MTLALRTVLSLAIAAAIVAAVYISMPSYPLTPRGIVLPVNGIQQAHQGQVKIYNLVPPRADAKPIGNISVEYHNVTITAEARAEIIEKAKQLAAQAGGDGLIFTTGHSMPATPSAMAMLVLRGTVIKTQ